MPARRVAWMLSGGQVECGQAVYRLRCCERAWCINPEHAGTGDLGDQLREEAARGLDSTFRSAEALARAARARRRQALTAQQVEQVQSQLSTGALQKDVALALGIHRMTVSRIAKGMHVSQRQPVLPAASVFAWCGGAGAS